MRKFLIIFLATLLCLKVALTASKKDESSEEIEYDTKEPLPGVGVITQPILQAVTLNHPNYRNDLGSSRFFAELLAKNKASIKILKDDKSAEEDDGGEENSSEKRDSDDGDSDDDDGDDDKKSDEDRDGDDDDGDSAGDKKSGEDKKSKDDDDSEERKSKAIKNRRDTGTRDKSPICILFGGYGPKTKNWY